MDSLEWRRLIGKEVLEESGVGVQFRASRVPLKVSAFVQYTRIWGALRQLEEADLPPNDDLSRVDFLVKVEHRLQIIIVHMYLLCAFLKRHGEGRFDFNSVVHPCP